MVAVDVGLTTRQRGMLAFIKRYYAERGVPPSFREIQDACYISSTSVVDYNLKHLIRMGYIRNVSSVVYGNRVLVPVRLDGEPCPMCGCHGGHE